MGRYFRVMNWGESHGTAVGAVVDGCPAGLSLTTDDIQPALDRRRPGQSHIVTQRKETDEVQILSGTIEGVTTGTPISLMIPNQGQKSKDYNNLQQAFRPSHADFTYQRKYGIRDVAGGGRSSARITAGWVAAGAIASKLLSTAGIEIIAWVEQVGSIRCDVDPESITRQKVEESVTRCPDAGVAVAMEAHILKIRKQGDTTGGVVRCYVNNMPIGLGEPVYDKLEADLAKAMLSINASKGFTIGSGFDGVVMTGSEHNDPFVNVDGEIKTSSNNSGGIQGGISNGMPLDFRVAFKPVATLLTQQKTLNVEGEETQLHVRGRHDPCVLPRAVPIVEAMAALVLADHWLAHRISRI
jgi:chorismate synthase